ncbi:cell division control protein 48 homolog B [Lycium barbarum]|uniref:cell division control protein 48 homolog B n=1 Tax=Lycium barbarum TaxID=112863 RepID=UPI00293F0FDF|nr:cell division control protein 48 homolog B [Lycium barbarum]XP_060215100.1 cell division control protein 48 homolog B [Lycium barbarum]XP_060215101.1 cell division control protein 48 homolog B [Lycium barbarum]XP_060215102.1 cell division control protein 48 homolog B [Lycium barbarum]
MESSSGSTSYAGEWRAEEAIAGNTEALQVLRELITYPLLYSAESRKLGLKWPRGLLLYGPPGTGKTSLVRAVVQECGAHLIVISPHSVHRAHAGESEKILREAFSEASSRAKLGKPSVIFLDEIDALCPRRDSRREQEIRVASQLFMLMDSIKSSSTSVSHVVVVASTNRPDAIDPALRRAGRFDAEIEVTTPTEEERLHILKLYTKKLQLDASVDLRAVAASCNGYVGADLEALCREAAMSAVRKCSDSNLDEDSYSINMEDWKHARAVVGPSITRGVTVEIPKVSWEDIGGLKDIKKKLQQAVEWPLKHSEAFERLGVSPSRGILLHGPPGCSKTTLAKAAAHAAQASFFSLSGAELYSMYVGEGEALLRNAFRRARLAAPSIIFFDEADVVATKRGGSSSGSSTVGERLLSTLLTEMDGLEQAKGILVLAATNRPHAIDAALMRPGRFDLVLYVPPPDLEARFEILCVHTRDMKLSNDVNLRQIAEDTELFTGAELEGLCREAGIVALRENISATVVCDRHFQIVKNSLKPALTEEEVVSYSSFMKNRSERSTNSFEASSKKSDKQTKNLLVLASPLTIGVISVVLYIGVRYFLMPTETLSRELTST